MLIAAKGKTTPNSRDLQLDGLKFLMIYCVVLGHLKYNDYGIELTKIIYSFHMPVFIFLSGYFTSLNSSKNKQVSWFKKTLLIYVIAQLGHIFLEILMGKKIGFNILFSPRFALWYLVSLILWRFLIWNVFNKTNDKLLIVASITLAIFSGVIPIGNTFSFQRTFAFFPYFVLGVIIKRRQLMDRIQRINIWLAIAIITIGFLISRHLPLFQPRDYYTSLNDIALRIGQTTLGVFLCFSIIKITKCTEFIKSFSSLGLFTLWIYVGHTYFVVLERNYLPQIGISYNIVFAQILSAVYCAIFIMLAKLFKIVGVSK